MQISHLVARYWLCLSLGYSYLVFRTRPAPLLVLCTWLLVYLYFVIVFSVLRCQDKIHHIHPPRCLVLYSHSCNNNMPSKLPCGIHSVCRWLKTDRWLNRSCQYITNIFSRVRVFLSSQTQGPESQWLLALLQIIIQLRMYLKMNWTYLIMSLGLMQVQKWTLRVFQTTLNLINHLH